jgi:hypothetical protein
LLPVTSSLVVNPRTCAGADTSATEVSENLTGPAASDYEATAGFVGRIVNEQTPDCNVGNAFESQKWCCKIWDAFAVFSYFISY